MKTVSIFLIFFLLWCSRLIRSSIRDKNRYIFKGLKYSVFWSVRVQTKSIFFASKFIKNTKIRIQKKRYRSDQNAPTPRKYWHSESTKKASVFWRLLMMVGWEGLTFTSFGRTGAHCRRQPAYFRLPCAGSRTCFSGTCFSV